MYIPYKIVCLKKLSFKYAYAIMFIYYPKGFKQLNNILEKVSKFEIK